MNTFKKNILKNGIASFFQKVIRVLEQLFLVPFFISCWGESFYGEWLTLTIIPNVLALANMGFGSAAGNTFVLEYVGGSDKKAFNTNKNAIFIITLAVFIAIFLSCLVLFILNYYHVFDKLLIPKNDAIIAVCILMLTRLLTFYTQYFDAYYRAARKASLGISLINVRSFLSVLLGLLVLLLGYSVVMFSLSQFLVNFCFNLYFGYKGKKILNWPKNYKAVRDLDKIKFIFKKGLSYLLTPVWQSVFFQGTTLVVRIVLGPDSVAIFNTMRTLTRSISQLFSMINVSVFPELQYEIGLKNLEKASRIFSVSFFVIFFLAAIGTIFMAIFGLWFYTIWTNNKINAPLTLWYILVVSILFNALWSMVGTIFRAFNQPKVFAFIGFVCSILSVIVTYILSRLIGLNGAAIGHFLMELLMSILVLPYACRLFGMSIKDLLSGGFDNFFKTLKKISKLNYLK